MLCSVVRCYHALLHAVQCCYMLDCVVEFYAAVLFCDVSCDVFCYQVHAVCSVVTCCIVLLNFVQQCYML